MSTLAGRLLVATPHTGGEIFRQSVVLLLHHDDEGAHGLVLNKPIDADVDAVLPGWHDHVTAPPQLFQGGPVGLDTALGLVRAPARRDDLGIKVLFGDLGVVDLDAPPQIVMPNVSDLRVFAGYSGWGPAQLEGELEAGAWYVLDARPEDPFTDEPAELWREVLRREGGKVSWLAGYPEDPQLN